jgi:sugar/nucleoside kinase (ribokinase family)
MHRTHFHLLLLHLATDVLEYAYLPAGLPLSLVYLLGAGFVDDWMGTREIVVVCIPLVEIVVKSREGAMEKCGIVENRRAVYSGETRALVDAIEEVSGDKKKCVKRIGGSGLNTALSLGECPGIRCRFFGPVGAGPLFPLVAGSTKRPGLEMHLVRRKSEVAICFVVLTGTMRTMVTKIEGHEIDEEIVRMARRFLVPGTILYLTRYVLDESAVPIESLAEREGVVFCINLSDPGVLRKDFGRTDRVIKKAAWVIGNRAEAEELYRQKTGERRSPSCSELADFLDSYLPNYAITNEDQHIIGSMIDGSGRARVEVLPLEIEGEINASGAGDAFAAGVLAAISEGCGLREIIEQGARYSYRRLVNKDALPEELFDVLR